MAEVPHLAAPRIYSQGEINGLFARYHLSFSDPNRIVELISTNWIWYKRRGYDRGSHREFALTGADTLYYIMIQISRLPNHRHRQDAENIAAECRHRISGAGPNNVLEPCPMAKPYIGEEGSSAGGSSRSSTIGPEEPEPGKEKPEVVKPGEQIASAAAPAPTVSTPPATSGISSAGGWKIGEPLPRPLLYPRSTSTQPPPEMVPENEAIKQVITDLRKERGAGDLILEEISVNFEEHHPKLHPTEYLDDPNETCLKLPEDCPFIVHPTPKVDVTITDRKRWGPMIVHDSRYGPKATGSGPLEPGSYIWQLCDKVREILVNPDVARAYTIIVRAHPSRYEEGSADNIKDEPPPTTEEIECMLRFVVSSFPPIFIVDPDSNPNLGKSLGLTYRGESGVFPRILLNGLLFDRIEQGQRDGISYFHFLYLIEATLMHEMGHFLNACLHIGHHDTTDFGTPRKMRLLLRNEDENPYHPSYDPAEPLEGEIGQIIEWLVFGFMVSGTFSLEQEDCLSRPLTAFCWGSYHDPRDQRREIKIDSFAAERLMRLPPGTRMTAAQLRECLGRLAIERALRASRETRSPGLGHTSGSSRSHGQDGNDAITEYDYSGGGSECSSAKSQGCAHMDSDTGGVADNINIDPQLLEQIPLKWDSESD